MKKSILLSIMIIAITVTMIAGATTAYFSDVETSNGNTLTAGTLDLQIDGGDTNVIKFNSTNMKPGSQPTGSYALKNIGTIDGYLDITKVTVKNLENGRSEVEKSAGDSTPNIGELGDVLNLRLYFDNDKDGYYSTGDDMFYNGKISDMPANLELDKLIPAGETIKINAVIDWWSTANDNLAQGDTVTFDLEFTLNQVK